MKIYIYAIAKNERRFCERFMASCAGADGVLVLDTGSTDGTPDELRRLGAEVDVALLENWRFDRARNMALALVPADADVCVADTTGELRRLTHLAQLAFIGKSLPPNNGGQTPIECAAVGVPAVYGPAMTNFKDVCRSLEDCGAAVKVRDAAAAREKLLALLADPAARAEMSSAAQAWHRGNQGATARVVAFFESVFSGERTRVK